VEPRAKGRLWQNGAPTDGEVENIYTNDNYHIPDYVVVAKEFWKVVSKRLNDPGTISEEDKVTREHAVSTNVSIDIAMELGITQDSVSAKFKEDFKYSVTISDTTTTEHTYRTVSHPTLYCDNRLWQRYLTIHVVVDKEPYNEEVVWAVDTVRAVIKPHVASGEEYQEHLISPPQGIKVPIDEVYSQLTYFDADGNRVLDVPK
jgi:hypothetical protein